MNLDDVILLKIFSYLPARDLASCSHVCKNWHRLVREDLENNRARKRIETVLFESSKWDHNSSITKIDRADFIRDWSLEESNIKTIPDFGIFTMNLPFNQCYIVEQNAVENGEELEENRRSKRRKHSNTTSELLSKNFPSILNILMRRSFKQVFISGYGFIGTNLARTRTVEIENDSIDPSFSGMLFPKSDLYRFEVRYLSPDDLNNLKSACDMRKLLELTEETDESERLIWLILLTRSNRSLKLFTDKINPIQKEMGFACSGGLPDLVCQNLENGIDRKKQANQVSLIGLIGKKSHVNVSQIFIPDQVDFNQVWKAKSDLLKSNQLDGFKSQFAFQISCCGRGKNYHNGVENHESSLLAKLFPKIPIIGVFVNGELGHDYLPNLKDHNSDLSTFGFSSIFTIVSIKN